MRFLNHWDQQVSPTVALTQISHKEIKKGVKTCENAYIESVSAVITHIPHFIL